LQASLFGKGQWRDGTWQAQRNADRQRDRLCNQRGDSAFGLAYNTDLGNHPDDSWAKNYIEKIFTNGRMNWGAALRWIDAMCTSSRWWWVFPVITAIGDR